jgi:hypothetical protein
MRQKCKAEDESSESDQEVMESRKRRRVHQRVDDEDMEVDTDVPVRDQFTSGEPAPEVDFSGSNWPVEFQNRMTPAERTVASPLSMLEGEAGPSRFSVEEKEKKKPPEGDEMEVEDVAGPLGNLANNAKPAEPAVKVEEEAVDPNRVRYNIVEVPPVASAVVPKPEPVEPVVPKVVIPWTKEKCKELKITTHKINDKMVIEIHDSGDEFLVDECVGDDEKEKGKAKDVEEDKAEELDASGEGEDTPDL